MNPSEIKNFHQHFVKWIAKTYPSGIMEEDWDVIQQEDKDHPYNTHPLCEVWYDSDEQSGSDNLAPIATSHIEVASCSYSEDTSN